MEQKETQKHRTITVTVVDSRNQHRPLQFSVHGNAYQFAYEWMDLERDLMMKFEAALEKLREMR